MFWIGKLQPHYGEMMHRIAIYDMDKTITRRATFGPFVMHALRRRPWRGAALPLMGLATLGYGLRLIGRGRLKQINLRLAAGRGCEAGALGEGFAQVTMRRNILPSAIAQIAADRAAGFRLVLASASCEFYVRPIAALLGFDAVIATATNRARIVGENCYGPAKRRMVEAWFKAEGIDPDQAEIRFYSDHVSDAPMFALAASPRVVNPHRALRRLAARKHWAVRDWRASDAELFE